ncbi:MAG TPA: hypothetical protein DCO78_00035, partial [Chitinophagaceae bacterium]|nr:hypothetical protein [Chitinophagaceae bacterium]
MIEQQQQWSPKKGFIFLYLPLHDLLKNSKYNFMGQQGFRKFMKEELSGAKKKEAFRQEKRQVKAERKAAGDEARKRKFEQQTGQAAPKPTWSKNTKSAAPKKGPAKPQYGKAKPQQQEPTKFTIV